MTPAILAGAGATLLAALAYGAFVLYGASIDGKRQSLRDRGKQPTTTADGKVQAKEIPKE